MKIIYHDAAEPTFALYQCIDLKQAADFFISEFGSRVPSFLVGLIKMTYSWLSNIHYSMIIVGSKNPTTLSAGAVSRVNDAIKSLTDVSSGYQYNFVYAAVARLFGYNGANTYAVSDLAVIDQT